MTRIQLTDKVTDSLAKMSDGNIGALNVLLQLRLKEGGVMKVIHLDSIKIYGSDIWVLYKDCCGEDINKLVHVLNENRMGELETQTIKHHIENCLPLEQ